MLDNTTDYTVMTTAEAFTEACFDMPEDNSNTCFLCDQPAVLNNHLCQSCIDENNA